MLSDRIKKEYQRLQMQEQVLEAKIAQLPAGKLLCARSNRSYKWYVSDGHERQYLPKSERKLAEKLAEKKYLSHLLKKVKQEKIAIEFYLRHHVENTDELECMLKPGQGYYELLAPYFAPLSKQQAEWASADYERNEYFPEFLIHETASGGKVRSKSEFLIDMMLFQYQIPFRYECVLQLGNHIVCPDFTIRHPKTDEIYYWEHFGLMDDENYRKKTGAKLQLYLEHGIIPSKRLITTFETKEDPLTYGQVKSVVEHYFL